MKKYLSFLTVVRKISTWNVLRSGVRGLGEGGFGLGLFIRPFRISRQTLPQPSLYLNNLILVRFPRTLRPIFTDFPWHTDFYRWGKGFLRVCVIRLWLTFKLSWVYELPVGFVAGVVGLRSGVNV